MLIPWASQQRGGSPAPPDALLTSDFRTASYTLNGAPCNLGDLWVEDTNIQPFDPGKIVPGVGFRLSAIGASGSLYEGPSLNPSAFAAINAAAGLTMVLETEITPGAANTDTGPTAYLFSDGFAGYRGMDSGPIYYALDHGYISIRDGGGILEQIDTHGRVQKYAVTLAPNLLGVSANGGVALAVTEAIQQFIATQFYWEAFVAPGDICTIRRVDIYPPITDLAQLQELSFPDPVAVADFENGAYSINGVPKSASDLWVVPAHLTIVADEGLKLTATNTATATANATADLFSALDLVAGFSGVIDVTTQVNNPVTDTIVISMGLFEDSFANYCYAAVKTNSTYLLVQPPGTLTDGDVPNNGANKLAFTLTPSACRFSVNGGAIYTGPAVPLSAFTKLILNLDFYNAAAVAQGIAVIRSLALYPSLTDAQLQALST